MTSNKKHDWNKTKLGSNPKSLKGENCSTKTYIKYSIIYTQAIKQHSYKIIKKIMMQDIKQELYKGFFVCKEDVRVNTRTPMESIVI